MKSSSLFASAQSNFTQDTTTSDDLMRDLIDSVIENDIKETKTSFHGKCRITTDRYLIVSDVILF